MADSRPSCVLLIDDAEIDNFINENIIRAVGVKHVHVFRGGQSAFEFLFNIQKNIDLFKSGIPQVIFLDLNMPLMDGFQFLSEFESLTEEFKGPIKFAILTSSHDPEDVKLATKYKRVLKFLNKPLSEKDVLSVMELYNESMKETVEK